MDDERNPRADPREVFHKDMANRIRELSEDINDPLIQALMRKHLKEMIAQLFLMNADKSRSELLDLEAKLVHQFDQELARLKRLYGK